MLVPCPQKGLAKCGSECRVPPLPAWFPARLPLLPGWLRQPGWLVCVASPASIPEPVGWSPLPSVRLGRRFSCCCAGLWAGLHPWVPRSPRGLCPPGEAAPGPLLRVLRPQSQCPAPAPLPQRGCSSFWGYSAPSPPPTALGTASHPCKACDIDVLKCHDSHLC